MLKGRVRWFDQSKGYGMIQADDDGRKLFVHFADINEWERNPLGPDDQVEFELLETPQGLRAINVRKLSYDESGSGS
ncbi:MAG: cold-shock protein [bacterium]